MPFNGYEKVYTALTLKLHHFPVLKLITEHLKKDLELGFMISRHRSVRLKLSTFSFHSLNDYLQRRLRSFKLFDKEKNNYFTVSKYSTDFSVFIYTFSQLLTA